MTIPVRGGPRRAPTLYDVASLAGVSHQTVSRLVKGQTNIRPEVRARVEAAIAELNYKPNLVARSLATAKSHRIGALFFDRLDEIGPTRIVQAAGDRAREAGYLLDIVGLDPRETSEIDAAIELVLQSGVGGILVFAPTAHVLEAIQKRDLHVPVHIESDVLTTGEPTETHDHGTNGIGVRLLTEHLADLGHTRFVHISGPADWFAARGRRREYEAVISERGLTSLGVFEGDWSPQSGYDAAMRIPLDEGVTAVVSSNDQMALGIFKALRERGLSVPQDVSVVGFDDIPESRFFYPPLTTARMDFERQGRIATEHLLRMMDPSLTIAEAQPVYPVLVMRDSVAPPPSSRPSTR